MEELIWSAHCSFLTCLAHEMAKRLGSAPLFNSSAYMVVFGWSHFLHDAWLFLEGACKKMRQKLCGFFNISLEVILHHVYYILLVVREPRGHPRVKERGVRCHALVRG